MAIKIKYRDPKITDFNKDEFIVNVQTGDIFYKADKKLFKLKGDDLTKTTDKITLNSDLEAKKAIFSSYTIGDMIIGSGDSNAFSVGSAAITVSGSIMPALNNSLYDIGSESFPFRKLWVTDNSIHMVKTGIGVGFGKVGSTFRIGKYILTSLGTETTTFTKQNLDDLKEGKSLQKEGKISASGDMNIDGTIKVRGSATFHSHITSSGNISCSGTIIADAFQSAGGDDQLDFTDDINVTGNITSSIHIKAVGFTGSLTGDVIGNVTGEATNVSNPLTVSTGLDLNAGVNWDGTYARTLTLDLTEVGFGGGANRIITDDGDGTVTAESGLSYDGDGLTITGDITASGAITASQFEGSNIGPIYDEYIYLTPIDFDHLTDKAGVTVAGEIENNGGYLADNGARGSYHCQKIIPKGYRAIAIMVKGSSASDEYRTYSSSYDVNTAVLVDGTAGNPNTEKTLADKITGGDGTYCSILWSSRGNTDVYGGYIKLEKT